MLQPLVPEFLELLKDPDIEIRKISLGTWNVAAHHKSNMIQDHISKFLPLLYQQTVKNPALITVVDMGPFKHTVDQGLETREVSLLPPDQNLLADPFNRVRLKQCCQYWNAYLQELTGVLSLNMSFLV